MTLMKDIRESIKTDKFQEFVRNFMLDLYPDKDYPTWVRDSLSAVNISLL